jgi:hypothetical protein
MKKRNSLFFVMACACMIVVSCRHHRGNTSIAFSESDHYYSMKARFSDERTRDVEHYMDEMIGDQSNMSFVNSRIDGQIAFNDHTNFYIKKYDGYLQIKLDKDNNSADSYEKVRDMCQGIKRLLANRRRY